MKLEKKIEYWNDKKLCQETWHLDGKLHREDGPSAIFYNQDGSVGAEHWHIGGKLHREDGPAVIRYDRDKKAYYQKWFLNDDMLSPEEIQDIKLKLEIEKITEQMLVGET